MCAILGYKSASFDCGLVERLLDGSRLRGVHAFGFSCPSTTGRPHTEKFIDYEQFKQSLLEKKPETFIAHFRYSTSGDWQVIDNNQPAQLGAVSIAFNGVLSQGSIPEMEKEFGVQITHENDAYVLIQKYRDEQFRKSANITYAMVGLEGSTLVAVRNPMRPLWLYEAEQTTILASTNDIITRAGLSGAVSLKQYQLHQW